MERERLLIDDEDSSTQWVATYNLSNSDLDDDFDNTSVKEVILNAEDFDTAVRYAQQYLRKMQSEEDTADTWKYAEIMSVVMH